MHSCGRCTRTHCLWFCASRLVLLDTPGRSRLCLETSGGAGGWRKGEKQGGRWGCRGHQANCIQVEDHQEPASLGGQDETAWKIGSGGLDDVHLWARSVHRCYPAHAHSLTTSTRYKQMRATTTGEDKWAKCIPHVNKHRNARRCTPSAATSSLRCLGERPGSWQQTAEEG